MRITTVGCGCAFSKRNYNQSYLLEESDDNGKVRKMIIDFGAKIPMALDNLGVDIHDIDDIYISHAHSDHVGGLEELAFLRYDWINKPRQWDDYFFSIKSHDNPRDYIDDSKKYKLYAPRLIANTYLMKELWEYSLRGGLETMEGFDATLETYFEPVPIKANVPFFWQGWRCDLIQQIHIMTGSVIKYTFGLLMAKPNHKTIYFTTDAQHCSVHQLEIFYKRADIIFQDCECDGVDMKKRKFIYCSGVHANYAQLAGFPSANSIKLPDEIKSKMILSHYQDFVDFNRDFMGNECNWEEEIKKDGFMALTHVGDVYEVTSETYKKLELLATTDSLTKLLNRRAVLERIKQAKLLFNRSGKPFIIILGDIDDFKKFNDKYGHDCGDYVLKTVAELMSSIVRKRDIVGRWGGEEFIILLNDTEMSQGKKIAEKMRNILCTNSLYYNNQSLSVSITLGVSIYNSAENIEDCIKNADKALYKGKKSGKNKVVIFETDFM